ncbi:MAG: hypothetical protein MK135_08190 [Polyangiaceae bacterium]|nr:hypothetical protein [Polyangiaceae bacterium]
MLTTAIIVPGYRQPRRAYKKLHAALCSAGYGVHHVTFESSWGRYGITHLAHELQDQLKPYRPEQTFLIGFSMGCLVVRRYLQEYGGTKRYPLFCAISGPHAGTHVARLAPGRAAREMTPGSSFLRELPAITTLPVERIVGLHTRFDQTILPPSSAIIPEVENLRFSVFGHDFMVRSRRVIGRLLEEASSA